MEVLSQGQKIKRARIYKGFTLKDICEDKISVSKLSCIENDKMSIEPWLIEHICKKLDLDVSYLNQEVREQVKDNIKQLSTNGNIYQYIEDLYYNLEISTENKYFDLAYEIVHLIFRYHLEKKELIKCHELAPMYYELSTKTGINEYIYYIDMGEFIFKSDEYSEAYGYFSIATEILKGEYSVDYAFYSGAALKKCICLLYLGENAEALDELRELCKVLRRREKTGDNPWIFAVDSILALENKENYDKEKEFYNIIKNNFNNFKELIYDYLLLLFKLNFKVQAIKHIEIVKAIAGKIDMDFNEELIMLNIELLMKNKEYEKSIELCDLLLNEVIEKNTKEYIEKLYYLKGKLLFSIGNLISAEIYFNLSLDFLTKLNKKSVLYKRYIEIGNLYYSMKNTKDAIKYINTAISLKNRI